MTKDVTAQENEFAALIVKGWGQFDAFKETHPDSKANNDSMIELASRFRKRVGVMSRIRDLYRSIKIQDIDSHGQHYQRVMQDREDARTDRNWTAVAAFGRLMAQMQGMLIDRSHVTFEASLSDDELVDAVAKGDGILAQAMRARLGSDKFDA